MSGYSKIYCIGEEGGFMGSDGINQIYLQILVGDGDRQWLEPHYFDRRLRPIGQITIIVPAGPYHPNALIDACLAFYPKYFEACPSLESVSESLQNETRIDFHFDGAPVGWEQLREEARSAFRDLTIYEAELTEVQR